jgi:hypothetical protein
MFLLVNNLPLAKKRRLSRIYKLIVYREWGVGCGGEKVAMITIYPKKSGERKRQKFWT